MTIDPATTATHPGTLASISEVADILGVKKQRADQITRNRGFPRPRDVLAVGRVWIREDVEAYRRDHRDADADSA